MGAVAASLPKGHTRLNPCGPLLAQLECFWALPLVRVFGADAVVGASMLGTDSPLTPELIERFLALQAMPKPLLGLADGTAGKGDGVGKQGGGGGGELKGAEALLLQVDKELSGQLVAILGKKGVDALVMPHAQRLCVSLLSSDTCNFVWDLCLIAGWHQMQAALTALLICLKDGLTACTDTKSTSAYLQASAPKVTAAQLQRVLEDHFMGAIRAEMQAPQPSAVLGLSGGD